MKVWKGERVFGHVHVGYTKSTKQRLNPEEDIKPSWIVFTIRHFPTYHYQHHCVLVIIIIIIQDGMNIVDVLAIMPFFVTLFMAEPLDADT